MSQYHDTRVTHAGVHILTFGCIEVFAAAFHSWEDETPRQFVRRTTGCDYELLSCEGQDYTWKELFDIGALPLIDNLLASGTQPQLLKLKENKLNNS